MHVPLVVLAKTLHYQSSYNALCIPGMMLIQFLSSVLPVSVGDRSGGFFVWRWEVEGLYYHECRE